MSFFKNKQFASAIDQIVEEKGIAREKVVEAIELALAAAYKREYGERSQIVKAKLDLEAPEDDLKIFQVKYVVEGVDEEGYLTSELPPRPDQEEGLTKSSWRPLSAKKEEKKDVSEKEEESRTKYNPERHLLLAEARQSNPLASIGDEIIIPLEPKTDFGRIAAQTAKQVIIQKLREIEREVVLKEFKSKEDGVVSGVVQRREGATVYIDLGRTSGLLLPAEQLFSDHYRVGQRFRFYIVRVEETNRGPVVILSRTHPRLVSRLFEVEVPEIENGSVEIKALAREPGSRSKIAVISKEEGIDPIGSLVGQKGVRVQTVINELSGEKIDIIEWSENPEKFITNAISPAKILRVKILNEERRHALVEVNDDQFSLAIGKKGQNVRLAAKLTNWRIDVRSPKETLTVEEIEEREKTPETATAETVIPEVSLPPFSSEPDKINPAESQENEPTPTPNAEKQ